MATPQGRRLRTTHPSKSRTQNLWILDPAYLPLRYSGGLSRIGEHIVLRLSVTATWGLANQGKGKIVLGR